MILVDKNMMKQMCAVGTQYCVPTARQKLGKYSATYILLLRSKESFILRTSA